VELLDVLVDKLGEIGVGGIVDLESRTFNALVDMSLNGFPADKAVATKMAEKYNTESEAALEEVHALLPPGPSKDGREWILSVAAHVREILELLGANLAKKSYPKTANTGEPSTSGDALGTIKKPEAARQWVEAYLRWKGLDKHYRDFAKQYVELIREDGTIKGSFDTVSTGRLSCRKPNLQQFRSGGAAERRGHAHPRRLQALGGREVHRRRLLPGRAADSRHRRCPRNRTARAHAGGVPEGRG
jgi:DNA polymerase I-like protein with 3'-5' exonuclease and polymerase domains